MMSRDKLYVDGGWVPSTATDTIAVENPATEQVLGHVPAGTAEDVDRGNGLVPAVGARVPDCQRVARP